MPSNEDNWQPLFDTDSDGLPVPTEAWWEGPGRVKEPPSDSRVDWRQVADQLAEALRGCQVPDDWPMAWPDGSSEGTPWVTEALAVYDEAVERDA